MKNFALALTLGISCASAMETSIAGTIGLDEGIARLDLSSTIESAAIRPCTEIEEDYAAFQKTIVATELPTDIFDAMSATYPIVAQYYTDQATSLIACLCKLNEQTSAETNEIDAEFNAIKIEKTSDLIEKYKGRAKYLIEYPAQIRELLDFITAAYTTNSGLSSYETLFSISSSGYHTYSGLFKDVKEENRRHISAYNFGSIAKKLNAEIQERFSTLVAALSADIDSSVLLALLGSGYSPLFHHVEHNSSFKTYIKSSGDVESIVKEFEYIGIAGEFVSQINRDQLLLNFKKEVIKTERKNKFNEKMRTLHQSVIDKIFDHIEASDKARKEAR